MKQETLVIQDGNNMDFYLLWLYMNANFMRINKCQNKTNNFSKNIGEHLFDFGVANYFLNKTHNAKSEKTKKPHKVSHIQLQIFF